MRLLTKEEMTAINDAMPPEAKYGEVFAAIADAEHIKTLLEVVVFVNAHKHHDGHISIRGAQWQDFLKSKGVVI